MTDFGKDPDDEQQRTQEPPGKSAEDDKEVGEETSEKGDESTEEVGVDMLSLVILDDPLMEQARQLLGDDSDEQALLAKARAAAKYPSPLLEGKSRGKPC